jgi:hypothetical protein
MQCRQNKSDMPAACDSLVCKLKREKKARENECGRQENLYVGRFASNEGFSCYASRARRAMTTEHNQCLLLEVVL